MTDKQNYPQQSQAVPTEAQILSACEEAGLWPNTAASWVANGAFGRYHAAINRMLAAAPQAPQPAQAVMAPEYAAAVRELAEQSGMSEAQVLRAAVRLYQAEQKGLVTVEHKEQIGPLAAPQPAQADKAPAKEADNCEPSDKKLTYRDSDGAFREVKGCSLTVDKLDRHWIWSEQLEHNIVYKVKGREDALIASIDSLLFTIQLRDERIAELQRIVNLAERFAEEAFPEEAET